MCDESWALEPVTLLVILLIATATYLTRISGYLLLRNRNFSPQLT